jgi:hypothetical protein
MSTSIATRTKRAITSVTRRGAKGLKSVAPDALGAAAKAAAGVVLDSTAKALAAGRTTVEQSTPAMKRAIGRLARGGRRRTRSTAKRRAK